MRCRSVFRRALTVMLVPLWMLAPGDHAQAEDGVLEISQACALGTGCFPGDAAGYPVTIASYGSYVLTSNLDVADVNTDAIEVTSGRGDVSIDLNRFTISGRVFCTGSGGTLSCVAGAGRGIDAEGRPRINVRNGTVGDFATGIATGRSARIRDIISFSNGGDGIRVGENSSVAGATASDNAGHGISVGRGSVVTQVTAKGNRGVGIAVGEAVVVSESTSRGNGSDGIETGNGSVVAASTAGSNSGHGIDAALGASVSHVATRANAAAGVHTTGASVVGLSAVDNGSNGIECNSPEGCTIADSILAGNGQNGVSLDNGSVSHAIATQNRTGFTTNTTQYTGCLALDNETNGFVLSSKSNLQGSSSIANGGDGIRAGGSLIGGTHVAENASDGLQATGDVMLQRSYLSGNRLADVFGGGSAAIDIFYRDVLARGKGIVKNNAKTHNLGRCHVFGSSLGNCP